MRVKENELKTEATEEQAKYRYSKTWLTVQIITSLRFNSPDDEDLGDHILDWSGIVAGTEQSSDTLVHNDEEEETEETEVWLPIICWYHHKSQQFKSHLAFDLIRHLLV